MRVSLVGIELDALQDDALDGGWDGRI